MNLSDAINMQTNSLKQAISMTMISKAVHQDAQSIGAVLEMADVSEMTGKGQNIDVSL